MIKKLCLLALSCGLLSSCYYDVEEELYGSLNCNTPESVSYSQDLNDIIVQNCATAACHSSGGTSPGDFSTYEGFKPYIDNGAVQSAAIDAKVMPPSGPLNPCDLALLQRWIDNGANDN